MAAQDHQVSRTPYLCIFISPLYTGNNQAGLGVQWALHWSYRSSKSNTAVRGPFPPCANKGHVRDLALFARLASGGHSPLASNGEKEVRGSGTRSGLRERAAAAWYGAQVRTVSADMFLGEKLSISRRCIKNSENADMDTFFSRARSERVPDTRRTNVRLYFAQDSNLSIEPQS